MADQYIGEIRYFPYLRGAPEGWMTCDGSLQSIANYNALYNLLGTTYGGDGNSTFGLPDLRGRVPIGVGPSNPVGTAVGTETVTLNTQQLPPHNHFLEASAVAATQTNPGGQVFAAGGNDVLLYVVPATVTPVAMNPAMIGVTGQGLPHENCAPTLAIQACIAWDGIYPPQNN